MKFDPINGEILNVNFLGTPSSYIITPVSGNTAATSGFIYLADTSGASFTITLPTPVSGRVVIVKDKTGSFQTNNLTVARNGSEMIEGIAANKTLQTNWGCWSFFSDGINWYMGPV